MKNTPKVVLQRQATGLARQGSSFLKYVGSIWHCRNSFRSPPSLFFPKSIYLAEEPYRPFHPSILPRNYSRDLLLLLFPSAVFVNEMVIASSSSELQSSILALCCIVIQTDNMYVLTNSKTNVFQIMLFIKLKYKQQQQVVELFFVVFN